MEPIALSKKSHVILEAIAEGHSYEQILAQYVAWTYQDIFEAAAEALNVLKTGVGKSYEKRMEEIRQEHPRAYEKWTDQEDDQLRQLVESRTTAKEIARILQRQPSAIRSRLDKLNLIAPQLSTNV
jgi:DNA-binding CsgD family transcriptional regulator